MTAAAADEYAPLLDAASAAGEGTSAQASEAAPSSPRPIDHSGEHDRRHRLPPGTRVGDHLIVRGVLGEGGTAIVYEALHTRLGASVALKVIDVSDEFMEGAHARLLREAHVCASLEDPHIPRIYDVGELPDGTPYVVMERVSGRTLENVLVQGALPLDIAVQITEDLLLAVDAIERAGIVHRDIKPPNIILQTNAEGMLRIRLMDFGVSKNVGNEREPTQKTDVHANPSLTQHGAIVGTPHYMAPEQIVGPSVDTRADLYAVGVVAYEMMSGRTAFEGETTGDVVAAVLHTRPLSLRKLRDVHEALDAWVDKAMSPRRSDRFQSARQMRDALREAWEAHLEQVGARGQRRWAKRARVAGALGLVAVGMMLPVPGSYDTGLARLLGRGPSPATNTAAVAAPVLQQAAAALAPQPASAEGSQRHQPSSESEWDLAQAVEASAQAIAATEAAKSARTPEPIAPSTTQVTLGMAIPSSLPGRRPMAAAPQSMGAPQQSPAAMRRVFGGQKAQAVATAQSSDGARGALVDDYVQKLDTATSAPPVSRLPSNPFDKIPDNPYGD
ncbi:MAG TPA: serine/threonine-protein kinase [Polyangiales bacterium]